MERMKAALLILGVFSIFALLITACVTIPDDVATGPYYNVEIDSIATADADLRGKSYVISSAMQEVSDEDLQFKEFAISLGGVLRGDIR